MHFVGCTRPEGQLESAPDAAAWPHSLVATGDGTVPRAVTWSAFWDEADRYCVRATWGGDAQEAWFSMVDEAEQGAATRTPRSVTVVPVPVARARASRFLLVGVRTAHGDRVVLVTRSSRRRLGSQPARRSR